MNWRKGFKRITWILSLSAFFFGLVLGIDEANNPLEIVLFTLLAVAFFVGIWVFFFIIGWVVKGFANDTSKGKQ